MRGRVTGMDGKQVRRAMKSVAVSALLVPLCLLAYPPVTPVKAGVGWLLYACNEAEKGDKSARGYCQGFIEGVANSMDSWCVPRDVAQEQFRDLIIAELKLLTPDSTEARSASEAIADIVADRWPCE